MGVQIIRHHRDCLGVGIDGLFILAFAGQTATQFHRLPMKFPVLTIFQAVKKSHIQYGSDWQQGRQTTLSRGWLVMYNQVRCCFPPTVSIEPMQWRKGRKWF